ncbi:MAG TPA: carboxypeptidase regulatory-like domain-containing protein, partial [Bryobacteraceae bacterium]|nr:carboxypeptidase regulatory-like domain-containing protein [Bryobacteraceae bacterium]
MRNVWRLCLSLLFLFASVTAVAQGTGSITGIVRDNTGAVVPSAQVTLLNTAQGTQLTTNTNESGEYLFAAVPPGNYSLEVTAAGFNRFVSQGIVLRVAEKQRLDAELAVGDVKTAVNVEATATHVETESAELSGIVTGKQMSQIVLNGRNFSQLVVLTPGVVSQTNQDEGTVGVNGRIDYAVNGGRAIYNNWEIDGGDNMDNGSNGTLNVYPSVDAIAEVKILTSNYGAQYGRNGSGTIQTVTKSGGQQFHGSAYEFTRNNFFNARNFFDDKTQTYIKNDWGYTIGGPVWIPKLYNRNKEKTFFFFSEEWRKDRVPGSTFDRQVPSSQERQGIFNDVCPAYSATNPNFVLKSYPDCPAMPGTRNLTAGTGMAYPNNAVAVDPNAVAIMAMVPAPTTDAGAQSRFTGARTLPTNWREELVRVDHNFTDTTRFFFRYIHDSWNQVVTPSLWSGSNFPTVGTNFVGPGVSMVAHLAHNVDPTLLNEFTFSYTTDHIFLTPFGTWQRPASMTMTGFFNNGFGGKLPAVSINNGAAYGGGFQADVAGWPWNNANPTYTFRDQIAKIWGSHNIYAGFYYAAQQKNENNGAETQGFLNFSNSSDVTTGNAWADFLLGRVSSFNQNNMQTKYYYRSRTFEPYVQDDWHITPRLTVNLGFRASFFGSYNERYSNFYNFYPSLYNPANAARIDVTGKV